jgi:cytochrome P450/predicted unusual protein kinase regulating ubiquinone biosynthesis (AarF/ABC1/UbiB family)
MTLAATPVYRMLRIAGTVAAALRRYEWLRVRERFGRPSTPADWERAHDRTAAALHDLGIDLAGLFVKVCQVVGARADVFPAPFIRRLGRFHDRVPPRPWAALRPHVERELGRPLGEVFSEIDAEPLAAASLAQVHRARLRDGSPVVIKVQYPEIARLARVDLASLRRALAVVAKIESNFDLRSVVMEVAEFVGLELDFAREADSTERVRAAFAGDPAVRVPSVHREYSSGKLLVLEYLDGIKVTDLDRLRAAGVDLEQVARQVAHVYATMIFRHGFFQGDPHPGNLLVLPGGGIGVLDFGLAKELPEGFGASVAAMILAGLGGDGAGALAAARAAGFTVADGDPATIPALVLMLLGERDADRSVSALLAANPVRQVPSHFALIGRVLILLNGLSHTLAPGQLLVQRALVEELAASGAVPTAAASDDGLPPGPDLPPLLLGLRWLRWPIPFLEECGRRWGDAFTVRFPGRPSAVFFSHPDAIRDIFTGNEEDLHAGEANVILQPLLGSHSLLLLDGREHLHERRLMQPPFHGERMQAYGTAMAAVADEAIARWPLGRPFPVHTEMQRITLDVILRTVFGLEEGEALGRLRRLLTELLAVLADPQLLVIGLDGSGVRDRATALRQQVDAALYAEIARRRAAGTAGRSDVCALLLEARDEVGRPLDDVHVRDELMTLLVAGHETSATSLAWAVHHVLANPTVLERLRRELRAGADVPEAAARNEWLDAVVKETLRLTPILPLVGRRLQRPMRVGGVDLPAGVVAAPCIYLAHRRPERWPDPERFDPERFVGTRPSPYEFLPFGGGVRRCLGMAFALYEMKIVLARVFSRVALEMAPGYAVRVVRRSITFAPSEGMPVVAARAA